MVLKSRKTSFTSTPVFPATFIRPPLFNRSSNRSSVYLSFSLRLETITDKDRKAPGQAISGSPCWAVPILPYSWSTAVSSLFNRSVPRNKSIFTANRLHSCIEAVVVQTRTWPLSFPFHFSLLLFASIRSVPRRSRKGSARRSPRLCPLCQRRRRNYFAATVDGNAGYTGRVWVRRCSRESALACLPRISYFLNDILRGTCASRFHGSFLGSGREKAVIKLNRRLPSLPMEMKLLRRATGSRNIKGERRRLILDLRVLKSFWQCRRKILKYQTKCQYETELPEANFAFTAISNESFPFRRSFFVWNEITHRRLRIMPIDASTKNRARETEYFTFMARDAQCV